jgi:hypothetical protein
MLSVVVVVVVMVLVMRWLGGDVMSEQRDLRDRGIGDEIGREENRRRRRAKDVFE